MRTMAETSWYDACEELDESLKIIENDIYDRINLENLKGKV